MELDVLLVQVDVVAGKVQSDDGLISVISAEKN